MEMGEASEQVLCLTDWHEKSAGRPCFGLIPTACGRDELAAGEGAADEVTVTSGVSRSVAEHSATGRRQSERKRDRGRGFSTVDERE